MITSINGIRAGLISLFGHFWVWLLRSTQPGWRTPKSWLIYSRNGSQHIRQIYLLQHWDIGDWQDGEYIGTCLRNPYYRIMGRPPAKALQLHQLLKFFENYGINPQPAPSIALPQLPPPEKRFGNAANWPGRRRGRLYTVATQSRITN